MSLESDLAEVDSECTASRPLSAKETRSKKVQFERDFRVEVRNLKAVSRRLVVACADISSSLVDLELINSQYNASLKLVHSKFDSISSLGEEFVDRSIEESLERVDDDSLDLLSRLHTSMNNARSQVKAEKPQNSSRLDQDIDVDNDSDDLSLKKFLHRICTQVSVSRLAIPEPEVFSGNPVQFSSWLNSFRTLVESRNIPEEERIYYLRKYVSGKAKDCIEGFLNLGTPESYLEATTLLQERFGSDFVVAHSFKQKLRDWPKIHNDDSVGLRSFSDYLHTVEVAKRGIHSLRFLDDELENRMLLLKLPDWCRTRWARKVAEEKTKFLNYPKFEKFVEFVKIESEIANDPITSASSSHESHTQRHSFKSKVTNSISTKGSQSCLECGGSHSLQKCDKFIGKSYDDRVAFIKENRICFGCLRQGHVSKFCRNRLKCDTCNGNHSTLLHIPDQLDGSKSSKVISNAMSTRSSNKMSSMVVPVWLSNSKSSNPPRLVYALLDSQSDQSFILDQTLDAFGIESKPVDLSISTTTGLNQSTSSRTCSDFVIRGHNLNEVVELPALCSRPFIPHNKEHFPSREFCGQHPHLEKISSNIYSFSNVEVGLLIGFDCPRALCPLDSIISNNHNSPFAVRTPVGWTVVGSSGLSNLSVSENQSVHRPDIVGQPSELDGLCLKKPPAPIASSGVIASLRQSPDQLNYSRPKPQGFNSLPATSLANKRKCTNVVTMCTSHPTSRIHRLHTRWKSHTDIQRGPNPRQRARLI